MIGHAFWWGPGWGFVGALLTAAFWILVILLVVGLVRRQGGRPSRASTALELLEERYAGGEIDRDEFLERRRTLLGIPSADAPPETPPR
jgi:putative membrane protein